MKNLTSIEKKGLALGSLSAILGSFLFGLVNAILLALKLEDFFSLFLFVFYFPLALIITFIPSAWVGIIFARQMEKDYSKGIFSKWKFLFWGIIVVTLFVIIFSGIIGFIIPKMPVEVFLSYTISAIIIANFVCVIASLYLSNQISKN